MIDAEKLAEEILTDKQEVKYNIQIIVRLLPLTREET